MMVMVMGKIAVLWWIVQPPDHVLIGGDCDDTSAFNLEPPGL